MEDTPRTLPPHLPFDIEYDADHTLRITDYQAPHLSSEGLFLCVIEMTNEAFSAVWKKQDQHPELGDHKYMCEKQSLAIAIEGSQVTAPLEYPDLVVIGNSLLQFQQQFITPALFFDFWFKGSLIGHGSARMQLTSNVTQSLSSG